MISQSERTLAMSSYTNHVQAPDATHLIMLWLDEDLQSLRNQRAELDARILRSEQRLDELRRVAGPASTQHPARVHHEAKPLPLPENTQSAAAVPSPAAATPPAAAMPAQAPDHGATNGASTPHTITTPATYETAIALHYRFGVIRTDALASALGVTESVAEEQLRADDRWTSTGNGWFMRTDVAESWIARRIVEILNAVRSVAIEPMFQSLKRIAAKKFLEHGCHMPSRSMLIKFVQGLRTEGVRFDIVHEIASVDAPVHDRELSGSTQTILKTFDAQHRALTGAEVAAKFEELGMSFASAQLALSTSPLITRFERGIYGFIGRNADMRDLASARARREAAKTTATDD